MGMRASPRELAGEIQKLQERLDALEAERRYLEDVEKKLAVSSSETERAHQNIGALSARVDAMLAQKRPGWPKGKPRGPRKPATASD